MSPNELSMMLDQWARANAPEYGLSVVDVEVAILGIADQEKVAADGERGGFFPFSVAMLTVRQQSLPFDVDDLKWGDISINEFRRRRSLSDEFARLFLQLCHDIWMQKDLAVRGRVVFR